MAAGGTSRGSAAFRGLVPGSFAMVMATGIIAIGAEQQNLTLLAQTMYAIAAVSYVVLAVLLVARVVVAPASVAADLTSHATGFAFLTTVAATNLLGGATGIIQGGWTAAWAFWWLGLALWVGLTYATLFAVVLGRAKPGPARGIDGTWFLLAVAPESIVVLGAMHLAREPSELLAFALIAALALGIVLYLIVVTLMIQRWAFTDLEPDDAEPQAWIAVGAAAITCLAGSKLLEAAASSHRVDRLAPFVEGIVVLAWATATFWIPLMVAMGVWRHVHHRVPLRYHPSYWTMVFPIGMYGAATFEMRAATGLTALGWLPRVALATAVAAWAVTFVGLVIEIAGARARGAAEGWPDDLVDR